MTADFGRRKVPAPVVTGVAICRSRRSLASTSTALAVHIYDVAHDLREVINSEHRESSVLFAGDAEIGQEAMLNTYPVLCGTERQCWSAEVPAGFEGQSI